MIPEDQLTEDAEKLPYCASPSELVIMIRLREFLSVYDAAERLKRAKRFLKSQNAALESTSKQD
jgi:hypothetical protein